MQNSEKITRLFRHHISENHLPEGNQLFRKEMILLVLGLGGLNYVPVAYQNGSTIPIKIIDAVTTAILGETVLYTSGELYYKMKVRPQYVAEDLTGIIEAPLTKEEFFKEVLGQGVLATASAVPLATTLFDAHLKIFEQFPALFWSAFAFILGVNAAMHLVPIELTMRDEVYGFLPCQFQRAWRWASNYQPSAKELGDEKRFGARKVVLDRINPTLANAKENFLNVLIGENLTEMQERLRAYESAPDELLKDMLACYAETAQLNVVTKNTARVLGAGTMSLACLGYAANPYLVFRNYFELSIGAAIGLTIVPIYFFMLLMAYFGDGMGVRLLQNMLSLKDILFGQASMRKKLPLVAKLYPTAFSILTAVILVVVAFSGAPAREMMQMAFASIFPAWLMKGMMGVVDIGLAMLAWYVPLDFTKMMLSYYMQYHGAAPAKSVAIIKAKIEALMCDFNRINPDLAEELESRLKPFLPTAAEETIEPGLRLSYKNSCPSLLYPRRGSREMLLSPDAGNYDSENLGLSCA